MINYIKYFCKLFLQLYFLLREWVIEEIRWWYIYSAIPMSPTSVLDLFFSGSYFDDKEDLKRNTFIPIFLCTFQNYFTSTLFYSFLLSFNLSLIHSSSTLFVFRSYCIASTIFYSCNRDSLYSSSSSIWLYFEWS